MQDMSLEDTGNPIDNNACGSAILLQLLKLVEIGKERTQGMLFREEKKEKRQKAAKYLFQLQIY